MEKLKRQEKGITLTALVVTIIVLLIMAGVTLGMLTGESSLIPNAFDAKKDTIKASDEEYLKLLINDWNIENTVGKNSQISGRAEERRGKQTSKNETIRIAKVGTRISLLEYIKKDWKENPNTIIVYVELKDEGLESERIRVKTKNNNLFNISNSTNKVEYIGVQM